MQKKFAKKLLIFFLLFGGLFFARLLLAADFGTEAVSNGLSGSLATDDPRTIIGRIINIALGILGTVAVGLVIYGGFVWMTSGGDEEKIGQGKKILKNGAIGLLIILASWAIATFILTKLGGAIGGNDNGCFDGQMQSCGCGGSMVCSGGSWGGCVGSNLQDCVNNVPTSCDSSPTAGCQALNQICAAGYFCSDSCLCQAQGGSGDSCDGNLNNQRCDADNSRCSEYLTCNPETCLCTGPPVITGISPVGGFCNFEPNVSCQQDQDCGAGDSCNETAANGAPDNFVSIFGKNFGDYSPENSRVIFLGSNNPREALSPATVNSLCVNFWNDDQIIIAVPSGVQSGPVKIVNKDNLSDLSNDGYGPRLDDFIANRISRPGLCSLDPKQGILSSEVNYQGINLFSGQAYFGNYQSNVSGLYSVFDNPNGLSGVSVTPNIKEGDSGSFVERVISGLPQKSNYLKFVKAPEEGDGPYIMSFTPTAGTSGQYITIKGSGFGGARDDNRVYFVSGNNKIEASYIFPAICSNSVWKNNQIIVKVPSGLSNDYYQLQVVLGTTIISTQNLNPNTFEFDNTLSLKTSLCKIDPEQGSIDTPVTLWGEYFGAPGSNGLVKFNYNQDANGEIGREKDADTIKTTVPKAATTGPVKVIKNNEWGNELNFAVGECTKNEECNNQVCCPENTYRQGRCVNSINECFVDVPTSVFEWGFSTAFDATTTPIFDSCLGLSKYLGSCYQGGMCPNSPGACSSPATNYQEVVGTCDFSCQSVPGCDASNCTYNNAIDKCVQNISSGSCDLAKKITVNVLGKDYTTEQSCNSNGKWEIVSAGSCPSGWTRITGNRCFQNDSNCSLCSDKFACEEVNSAGRCVSQKLCTDKASCIDNPTINEADKCVIEVEPSCECCCRIGKDQEDCCAGLKCSGTCGSDLINNSNTYGSCSGCGLVGSTVEEHDAACNCSGHDSQFCDISAEHPEGICTDCSNIDSQENCGDHSSACCFDANKTATTTDDSCRGVTASGVISKVKGTTDYGYCAYFNCFSETQAPLGDPNECASDNPLKIGFFNKVENCVKDCPSGIGSDPCRAFDKNQASCSNEPNCCYDSTTLNCLAGDKISGGVNNGFCAYYNCQTPPGNPLLCDLTPTTIPGFASTASCEFSCGNPPGGAGLGCSDNNATSSCNFGLCNFPGFACLKDTGAGGTYPDCGTCCCQVGNNPDSCATPETPNLHCQADKGSCTGAARGLCCGCTKDSDCGSINTVGCGIDTCCEARPSVVSTLPAAAANNVCRNASLKITFNQNMDLTSFGNNFLLFEERAYGNGVCPAGTFLADSQLTEQLANQMPTNIFARLWKNINFKISRIFNLNNNQALATPPEANKLYCVVAGVTSAEEDGEQTSLIFTPSKLLSPATKYYAVIKGDEALNSQTGILSFAKIGLNERGFNNGNDNFINYSQIKFNNRVYPNSYSFQFTTLSDQGVNAGLCVIDHITIGPASYLFKTTVNDLNEKDDNINDRTFDTQADRDKVFTAQVYSANNQLLHPVGGYAWNWVWSIDDESIAKINTVSNIPENRKLIAAQLNVTDGQTKLTAKIDMSNFRTTAGCGGNCNSYFIGDGELKSSDIYIFVCDNPWPAVRANGEWYPWYDLAGNCSTNSTNCENFNYKFFYCRDAGAAGTLDDLPVIVSSAVVSGQGSNLLCSSDKTACSPLNSACGSDKNGDGSPDGLCLWNVLKESYFFRESILPGGEITQAIDTGKGGEVQLDWQSPASGVAAYRIYYLKSGKGTMFSKYIKATTACVANGLDYKCSAKISQLTNGQPYVFKLTAISNNQVESALSNEKTATPSDQTRPARPAKPTVQINDSTVKFTWAANSTNDKVSFYRLYRGISQLTYGESFDSAKNATSLTFERSQFSASLNYFALSAINTNNKESDKSEELTVDLR